jgi:transglutaminase-like putative cysteine protease
MSHKLALSLLFLLFTIISNSQSNKTNALTLSSELKEHANAVIRYKTLEIEIKDYNKMLVKEHRIVTVLNDYGRKNISAYLGYDDAVNIKKIHAIVYDAFGKEIKSFKERDFKNVSAVSGGTLFSDNREKYLSYTPSNYPFTVEFTSEYVTSTTAFMPRWMPIEGYYVSTEFSSFKVINSSGIVLKKKATNFKDYNITEVSEFNFEASNLKAIKAEAFAPDFSAFAPRLKLALQEFDMKGVKGNNTGWQSFGKWVDTDLNKGTETLPESVIAEVKNLTAGVSSNLEKAKIVYKYMQNKTRYISVQVGIGGWKPMQASDVDKLSYGDCKALSNYTKALLNAVGVEAHYTLIYGKRDIENLDKEFSSQQGNHAILALPHQDDYVFLECTNQTTPFGYIANFTDDRDALIITPEGGKIVHTTAYNTLDNLQTSKATIALSDIGDLTASLEIISQGTQYNKYENIEDTDDKDKTLYYKNQFDNINNLNILAMRFNNDKEHIVFTENLELQATNYGSKAGNRILVAPNVFNKNSYIPPRYKNRTLPFEVDRGFVDKDEFVFTLASNLTIEAVFEPVTLNNKFGAYSISIEILGDNTFKYNRSLTINKGAYTKEDYKAFRKFYSNIAKYDKSKIALKK